MTQGSLTKWAGKDDEEGQRERKWCLCQCVCVHVHTGGWGGWCHGQGSSPHPGPLATGHQILEMSYG